MEGPFEDLGGAVSISALYASRKDEISALEEQISSQRSSGHRRAWQLLPRHLRRRAGSHNPYRIPKRLRSMAVHQMLQSARNTGTDSSARVALPAEPDRELLDRLTAPSERKRGRPPRPMRRALPRLLGNAGLRRMGTHQWHAKRFHMTRWGHFSVPWSSTNKSSRAVLRHVSSRSASARGGFGGCLIHDSSYASLFSVHATSSASMVLFLSAAVGLSSAHLLFQSHLEAMVIPVALYQQNGSPLATVLLQWHSSDSTVIEAFICVPTPSSTGFVWEALQRGVAGPGDWSTEIKVASLPTSMCRFEILGHPSAVAHCLLTAVLCEDSGYARDVETQWIISSLNRQLSGGTGPFPPKQSFWSPSAIYPCSIPPPDMTLQHSRQLFRQTRAGVIKSRPSHTRPQLPALTTYTPDRLGAFRPFSALDSKFWARNDRVPIWLSASVESGVREAAASGVTVIAPAHCAQKLWLSLVLTPTVRTRPIGVRDLVQDWRFEMGLTPFWLDRYPTSPAATRDFEIHAASARARWVARPPGKRAPVHLAAFLDGFSEPFSLLWDELCSMVPLRPLVPSPIGPTPAGLLQAWLELAPVNGSVSPQQFTHTVLVHGARIYQNSAASSNLQCRLPEIEAAFGPLHVVGLVVYGAYSLKSGRSLALCWMHSTVMRNGGHLLARNPQSRVVHRVLATLVS